MRTMDGEKQFVVRGIMKSGGLTAAFGGNVAVMDIYAAQKVFGRGRRFDRIDLALQEGVTLQQGRTAIEMAIGAGFKVEPPSSRGQQLDQVLRVYSFTMSVNSAFALFIGMFIIYNAFAIAVTQRRREIGILRALGASRAQIRNLFLLEGGLAGVVGSLVGLGFGVLLARGTAGYIANMVQGVYGVAERSIELATDPVLMAAAFVMGVATSVLAAFLPARNAARVDPVKALQKGRYQLLSAGENRARRIAAIVLGAGALVALAFSSISWVFYAGYAMTILAMLLLSPSAALWLTRAFRPLLKWMLPVEGALAADSLIQSPRRTSATVTALMLSLSLVVGLGGIARASVESILDWTDTALNPDLFITPTELLSDRNFRYPDSMGPELRQIEGVDEIQAVRTQRVQYGSQPVLILAIDAESFGRRGRRPPVEGPEDMYERATKGHGVILSDHFIGRFNLHYGQTIDLPTPTGMHRFPIAGIVVDWADQQGVVIMDRTTYKAYFLDDTVNTFRVYAKQGASVPDLRQRIIERFASTTRMFVLTNAEVRAWIYGLAKQWLSLSYAQIFIAVLVAILGIVNTLTVSILDRRRELGVLQAVGGLRKQIRYTVWMEALAIGIVGLVLGLGVGAVSLRYVLEMAQRDVTGNALAYRYPFGIAAMLLPLIMGSAFLAALWPAESAVRGSLVEALEYE